MSECEYSDEAENCSNLSELKKQRGSIKGRLTAFEKYVGKYENISLSERQQTELQLRIESISRLFHSFNKIQDKIEQLLDNSDLLKQGEYRDTFEDQYFNVMSLAKCLIGSNKTNNKGNGDSQGSCVSNNSLSIKLPEIKLPSFDGSYDRWLEYRNSYVSMIHKRSDLDAIQKFHYLKSSLTGAALQVISALEFTALNYSHAWELLENRYHNNRLLIHNHVKSLFATPNITKESPLQIRRIIDTVLRNLRALQSLDEPTDSWDTLLIYIIVSKLDLSTEREWEHYKGSIPSNSQREKIKLDDLLTFLRNRADMLDMIQNNHARPAVAYKHNTDNKKYVSNIPPNQTHSFVSTRNIPTKSNRIRPCVMCGGNHALYTCYNFLNLSITDRIKLTKDKNLCSNCLRSGHNISDCLFGPCKQCQQKHNTLLHYDNHTYTSKSVCIATAAAAGAHHSQSADNEKPVSCALSSIVNYTHNSLNGNESYQTSSHVLLSTALVEVMDNNNQYHTARALLDSGSQNSFISEKLFKRLNVLLIQSTIRISGVGQSVLHSNKLCNLNLRSKLNNFNTELKCFVLPCITSSLPTIPCCNYKSLKIPDNIKLADPNFGVPSEVDLLIGADMFWSLLEDQRIRLNNGPYLQSSKFGWLLSGPIFANSLLQCNNESQCNFSQETNIDSQLRIFFELEEINKSDSVLTKEERACEDYFRKTTIRDSNGRFSVRIPFKESPEVLGESYERAKSRFLALERKLDRSPTYKKMYNDFMKEYRDLGHMSLITKFDHPYYFLPHHGVLREQSTTTKLRVVFDASAVTTSNKSLNDIQHTGPPLQNDILSILIRFRQYKYVACADVEKMYRQILIHPDQRNLQLILWRENNYDDLQIFQLNTVTYGTASAPYLSMRCLRQLAIESSDEVVARAIKEDMFVDDLIFGEDDPELLVDICDRISKLLESACFNLRKWIFNFDVNTKLTKDLATGDHCQNKTLGLGWQVDTDELHYSLNLNNNFVVTKRSIMSVISQIYDPLGLLSPSIITVKIILQKLWLSKIGWDDKVPREIEYYWTSFIRTLTYLNQLRIPRYIMSDYIEFCELHIFTDASQHAYGACAYIRTYSNNSIITTKLLCAKSKVAPVKPICTIPRLELCGALLGARLYNKIINSLRINFTDVFFWTDSTIVMSWIKMSPHRLKTFVQNRVSQLNELTHDASWLHVDSKDNPADIVSRGVSLDELQRSDHWWNGPLFLREFKISQTQNFILDENLIPELKTLNQNVMLCTEQTDVIDFCRFSSFIRIKRTFAYVLRFINNIRKGKQRKTGLLSVDELEGAQMTLARLAQQQSFSLEYKSLITNRTIKCKRLLGLNVFVDKDKLIRVGGRLNNSPYFNDNKKHPVVLCSKHTFTKLLFQYEHKRLLHGGPQLLLASIRECWWPLGGRSLARKTVRECITCVRFKGMIAQPQMGNLPAERLEPGFPFMRTGVDYAGPVMILSRRGRGAALSKAYICLFICFCTRSVHLELVTSLSTQDYILAIKRFIARRGKPVEIISDNGKNFIGAEKEFILHLNQNNKEIIEFAANNNIKFSFIPPYAPHFGGLWEAGVKSCKHHLRRVIGGAHLTYEELSTVLAQIEAILNSRPLTPLSPDPSDLQPLTPAHFLIGRPLTVPACQDLTATPSHRLLRYGLIEQMRQQFWKRWSTEYVAELQTRTKWKVNQSDVQLNRLALIKDDNLPPLKWQLGRIIQIHPGTDGISRVADLRTSSGVIRRVFSKICPLPVLTDDASNNAAVDPVGTC